jgi:hypothetical protein
MDASLLGRATLTATFRELQRQKLQLRRLPTYNHIQMEWLIRAGQTCHSNVTGFL